MQKSVKHHKSKRRHHKSKRTHIKMLGGGEPPIEPYYVIPIVVLNNEEFKGIFTDKENNNYIKKTTIKSIRYKRTKQIQQLQKPTYSEDTDKTTYDIIQSGVEIPVIEFIIETEKPGVEKEITIVCNYNLSDKLYQMYGRTYQFYKFFPFNGSPAETIYSIIETRELNSRYHVIHELVGNLALYIRENELRENELRENESRLEIESNIYRPNKSSTSTFMSWFK